MLSEKDLNWLVELACSFGVIEHLNVLRSFRTKLKNILIIPVLVTYYQLLVPYFSL